MWVKYLFNILFTVYQLHLDIERLIDVLCHVLRTIYRAVLATGATKADHQVREPTFDISLHRRVNQ